MQTKRATGLAFLFPIGLLPLLAGCLVGQAPGEGRVFDLQEPVTGGRYYLYLPEDYLAAERDGLTQRHWPLVVTFHGMKPFDNAHSQIREWQQEADRYGFVVAAPRCATPHLLREFPVRHVHPGVRRDEALTMHMLDDVARRVDVDPAKVLSTSWSSGGYLAHYMVNRHPDRFSCVAPRQSNFSADILDAQQVSRYRQMKVGIFYTENDFAICRRESQEGARWYSQRGFDVTFAVFKDLGHARRPSVAAAFFAETCGAEAKTPPTELARMQVTDVPLPTLTGQEKAATVADRADRSTAEPESASPAVRAPQPRPQPSTWTQPRDEHGLGGMAVRAIAPDAEHAAEPTLPPRPIASSPRPAARPPLRVRVSSTIGIAPHLVSFSAIAPLELRRGAYFLWTDNGEPISNGINGQKYFITPGVHDLKLLMTTSDGREYAAQKAITVLERMRDDGTATHP